MPGLVTGQTRKFDGAAPRQEERCLAFATGHHARLGAASPLLELEAGVVRMIAQASIRA